MPHQELKEYSDSYINDLDFNLADKVESLINYFNDYGIDYDNFSETLNLENNVKNAYPTNEHYMLVPGQYNLDKWVSALKEIYNLEKQNVSRHNAINQITDSWIPVEKFNFLNWLKFYTDGNHLKYKKAQINFNGLPHYLLDINQQQKQPELSNNDNFSKLEKKQIIEKQRHKIISRLDSAEKLLRSEDGNLFAGDELEALIDAIYSLKKKIQVVNKLSLNNNLYEDMIIRQANILKSHGFDKSASVLYKMSQDTEANESFIQSIQPTSDPALTPMPNIQPQTGGLPNMEPYHAPIADNESNISPGISEFLDNLETGAFTPKKELDEVEKNTDNQNVEDEVIIIEAQAQTTLNPQNQQKPNSNPTSNNVVQNTVVNDNIDTMLDSVFKNVTTDDVIKKLEDLSQIFNTREIPRQLALVDIMLNSLGLAQYFPSLSEATEKALDAHNYISIRIDGILSKLKNSLDNSKINLQDHNTGISTQDTSEVQSQLENEDQAENLRKQRRKEKEQKKLENEFKENPEINLEDELQKEQNVQTSTPPSKPVELPATQPTNQSDIVSKINNIQ